MSGPGPRLLIALTLAGLAGAAVAVLGVGAWMLARDLARPDAAPADLIAQYATFAAVALVTAAVAAWRLLDAGLGAPLESLRRTAQTVTSANADLRIDTESFHLLGDLPETINRLAEALSEARHETGQKVEAANAQAEEQKARLAAILQNLQEGVVVCNLRHQVLLYNRKALHLLHVIGEMGLGRPLFSVLTREPVLHTLERLTNRVRDGRHRTDPRGTSAAFVAATTDGRFVLEAQMSLILDEADQPTGYVLSFDDITSDLAALGKRDSLLRETTEGMRPPVANLRAAAEMLVAAPDLPPDRRRAFEEVIDTESAVLAERIDKAASEYREIITGHWPMADFWSANLVSCLSRRMKELGGPDVLMTGLPTWLHGDSHSLLVALESLVRRAAAETGRTAFDIEVTPTDRRLYLDVAWEGTPIPSSVLDGWLDERIEESPGGLTLRDILEHHQSSLWSEPHRPHFARIRIPMLGPVRLHRTSPTVLPPRPEFYDFDLLNRPLPGSLGEARLKDLTYVVFDTETTGLEPSKGDEIISIAGVRIVNGRILAGESFSRLVDPGRAIPPASIKFHGITDEMVRGAPPIGIVLSQFKAFVGDAVLVAHNAAFDMKFLKLKEEATGIRFDNPVLDTLLLSAHVHDHTELHNLDDIASRFGVEITQRHTALGDAIATAAIFVRMIDLLEEIEVRTLDDALKTANSMVALRAAQSRF